MKVSAFANTLARLTLALAGPLVVFGVLYLVAVEPGRSSAKAARGQLDAIRAELDRERAIVRRNFPRVTEMSANQEFEQRTPEENPASDVADAITSLANGPVVGGVKDLSIEIVSADGAPVDPRIALFQTRVTHTPMTVTFDAEFVQIGRFFWNLRMLPSTFELRSVELGPAAGSLMRVKLVLFVFQRPGSAAPDRLQVAALQQVDLATAPVWARDPFAAEPEPLREVALEPPDPVVNSILFSAQRRVALVDGRIVEPGDRLPSGFVGAIDEDGITIVSPTGLAKHLRLERLMLQMARR